MASAAWIQKRKDRLARLLAAHVYWRDNIINPAITELNESKAEDPAMQEINDVLTPAVLKINLYRPVLERFIAETNAMVPDTPLPPPPPPLPAPTITDFRIVAG